MRIFDYHGSLMRAPLQDIISAEQFNDRLDDYQHFRMYAEIVEDYSCRELTYQQDALEAFAGIAHFLEQWHVSEFFWGVSLKYLETAMLFEIGYQNTILRRRQFPS